jgi:prephenate dehydratase
VQDAAAALDARIARLAISDEVTVSVRHCLLALPGASLGSIRHVGSHPVALAQCQRFLRAHPDVQYHRAYDTAGAARELATHACISEPHARSWLGAVQHESVLSLAVIASARAAARYGLEIVRADLQDNASNATRFAVVHSRQGRRW